jgi:hypothetical protein
MTVAKERFDVRERMGKDREKKKIPVRNEDPPSRRDGLRPGKTGMEADDAVLEGPVDPVLPIAGTGSDSVPCLCSFGAGEVSGI